MEEKFEDTKGILRIRKSKNNRQNNDQMKKDKQRSTRHICGHLRHRCKPSHGDRKTFDVMTST